MPLPKYFPPRKGLARKQFALHFWGEIGWFQDCGAGTANALAIGLKATPVLGFMLFLCHGAGRVESVY